MTTITLRQAIKLVRFFGGHDCEVTVGENLPNHPPGLYAWCTEYPEEGSDYLGPTEVDDALADKGMVDPGDQLHRDVLALVEQLVAVNPAADSAEGKLLDQLSAAVEQYELVKFPLSSSADESGVLGTPETKGPEHG